jgi:hypothetical protein
MSVVSKERLLVSIKTPLQAAWIIVGVLFPLWSGTLRSEMVQPRKLVDAHTAGILEKGQCDLESRIYPAGDTSYSAGLLIGIDAGITNRLTIGLSYGGEGVVGRGPHARPNPLPGWLVKYRLFEESVLFPGIALGYDHQGHGGIADSSLFSYEGYIYKSPGFFIAASKNFLFLNAVQFGLHAMGNYSMEDVDNVNWPNLIAGIDIGIHEELAIVAEYDFGFNLTDGNQKYYAEPSDGYLNAGLRWAFSPEFYIEFDARDLLENRKDDSGRILGWSREIKLVFIPTF